MFNFIKYWTKSAKENGDDKFNENVILNQLPDSKMLGDTSVICFSKAGIINTDRIGIGSYLVILGNNLDIIDVEGSKCIPQGFLKTATKRIPDLYNRPSIKMTAKIATLCNDSELKYDYDIREFNYKGELLEACLKAFAEKIGLPDKNLDERRLMKKPSDRYTEVSDFYNRNYPKVCTYKFSKERRLMSVIVGKDTLLVKGSLMIILDRCNRYLDDSDGIVKELNCEIKNKINSIYKMWSGGQNHYSCIGFAYKDAPDFELWKSDEMLKCNEHEKELIFVGAVGIRNVIDENALNKINEYKSANVRLILCTGDSTNTASSIAKSISLIHENDDVNKKVTNSFRWEKMSKKEKEETAKNVAVFAYMEPRSLSELVQILLKQKNVVKVVNEDVNYIDLNKIDNATEVETSSDENENDEKNFDEMKNKLKDYDELKNKLKDYDELKNKLKDYDELKNKLKDYDELKNKVKDYESFCSDKSPQETNNENYFIDNEEEENFKILGSVGEGATSITYKIVDTRNNNFMCKKVIKYKESQATIKDAQNVIKEFQVLYNLNHPCICKAYGINMQENLSILIEGENKEVTTIALFLEYIEYKLDKILNMTIINNTMKTKIVIDIVHAMNYLHKKGIMHRDLKIDNIMLNSVFDTKIVDFGLVKINENIFNQYSFVEDSLTRGIGTFAYMSPEMINEEEYDNKTDVYSFGVVLYFMFVGSLPKQNIRDKSSGKKISLPSPSASLSEFCVNLISKCMSPNSIDRPSFEEILIEMRKNSYGLANDVDQIIISKRDKELDFFENKH